MYAHINTHAHSEVTESKDEEDFDQFLESVKARQLSLTAKGEPRPYLRPYHRQQHIVNMSLEVIKIRLVQYITED